MHPDESRGVLHVRLVESRSVVSRRDEMPNLGNDTLAFHLVGASMKDRNMCILREIYQPQADTGLRCSCTRGTRAGSSCRAGSS